MDVHRKQNLENRFFALLPSVQRSSAAIKIFYSNISPSPVALIGFNPGGSPEKLSTQFSSSHFYERGEHDYVDCEYPLARKMRNFLLESGIASSLDSIRQIPKINLIFHRSRSTDSLGDPKNFINLSAPFVIEMLQEINPRIIIFEGIKTLHLFEKYICGNSLEISCHLGGKLRQIQLRFSNGNHCIGIALAHPTGSRWRSADWIEAAQSVSKFSPIRL